MTDKITRGSGCVFKDLGIEKSDRAKALAAWNDIEEHIIACEVGCGPITDALEQLRTYIEGQAVDVDWRDIQNAALDACITLTATEAADLEASLNQRGLIRQGWKPTPVPDEWTVDTGAIESNRWNTDIAGFTKLIQESGGFWTMDMPLKYLDIRIDTRDGGFLIKDRDGNAISPNRVLDAIREWRERTGEAGMNLPERNQK